VGALRRPVAAAQRVYAPSSPAPRTGRRPQRVAVIGADHYHATSTPNYLRILQTEGIEIVGVHAPDTTVAAKWAGQYGSTPYTDYRALVEKTKPEFVIALGRHVAMPAEFRFLVETGIPFLMEKPWGIDDRTVNDLADLAESKRAWAAVPMPFRYGLFAETAVAMRDRGELGAISHMLFRFNQPGVQRYVDLGSP
jgi:predicted dehydrogenase